MSKVDFLTGVDEKRGRVCILQESVEAFGIPGWHVELTEDELLELYAKISVEVSAVVRRVIFEKARNSK